MQNNKRIGWVDIARGAGILSIIFSHTGYLPLSIILTPVIHTFMIPVFLFIGGYLFHTGTDFLSFAKNIIKKLLTPYVIFFLISSVIWFFIRSGIPLAFWIFHIRHYFTVLYKEKGQWSTGRYGFWLPIFLLWYWFVLFIIGGRDKTL